MVHTPHHGAQYPITPGALATHSHTNLVMTADPAGKQQNPLRGGGSIHP